MSKKQLCLLLRLCIIALGLCTLIFGGVWYPASFGLVDISFIHKTSLEISVVQIWFMLVIFWITAVPCLYLLICSWRISTAIKIEKLFSLETAKRLKNMAMLFVVDLGVFFVANIIFTIIGINEFALLHFALVIVGLVITVALSAISYYITKATEIKEENEGTI